MWSEVWPAIARTVAHSSARRLAAEPSIPTRMGWVRTAWVVMRGYQVWSPARTSISLMATRRSRVTM